MTGVTGASALAQASGAALMASASLAATTTLGEWLPTIEKRATLGQIGAVSVALAQRLNSEDSTIDNNLLCQLASKQLAIQARALVKLRDGEAYRGFLDPYERMNLANLGEGVAAAFEVAPPVLANGKPATLAGRHAGSILGYAAYRTLTGVGNVLIGRGWLWGKTASQKAYAPNLEQMRGRVRFQHTPPPTPTSSDTATKHTQAFAAEIKWAVSGKPVMILTARIASAPLKYASQPSRGSLLLKPATGGRSG